MCNFFRGGTLCQGLPGIRYNNIEKNVTKMKNFRPARLKNNHRDPETKRKTGSVKISLIYLDLKSHSLIYVWGSGVHLNPESVNGHLRFKDCNPGEIPSEGTLSNG